MTGGAGTIYHVWQQLSMISIFGIILIAAAMISIFGITLIAAAMFTIFGKHSSCYQPQP
jgi:hypothetical protein